MGIDCFALTLAVGLVACASPAEGGSGGRSEASGALTVYRVRFDAEALAAPLHLSPDAVVAVFRDGRAANPFCRQWADLHLAPLAGEKVRRARLHTLTGRSNLKLQQSVNTGSRREAEPEDLTEAIAAEGAYLLADVRGFPVIDFVLLDARWFEAHDDAGSLTTAGWSADRTWAAIRADYRLVIREVPL